MTNWTNPAKALQKLLREDRHAATRIAKAVGRTRASVYLWATEQTTPSAKIRANLEAVTGIPAWHWLSDIERAAMLSRKT